MTTATEEKHVLHITTAAGDVRHMWDPSNRDEVAVAKAAFDEGKAKGMLAYTVEEDGSKGEVIKRFDKSLGKIIMTRQLRGG